MRSFLMSRSPWNRVNVILFFSATILFTACQPLREQYPEDSRDAGTQAQERLIISTDTHRTMQADTFIMRDCNRNGILDWTEIERKPFALEEGRTYRVGQEPSAAAAGDFNHDGHLDLAVTNEEDDTVAILLNQGGGNFIRHQASPPVGDQPTAVASADLNGDGYDDLAVAEDADATLSVLLSNGDGSFAPAVTYGDRGDRGNRATVAAADIDEDGGVDLAFAYYDHEGSQGYVKLLVLWNTGNNGTFEYSGIWNYPSLPSRVQLALADLDGDGDQDFVVGLSDGRVGLVENRGNRSTQARGVHAIGYAPLAAADLTGDGRAEIVASTLLSSDPDDPQGFAVSYLGETVSDITETRTLDLGVHPSSIALADLDSDGMSDIVVMDGANELMAFLNKGDRHFEAARVFPTVGGRGKVITAELDGRTPPDLAIVHGADDRLSVLLNDSTISRDANANGVPDACDIASGSSTDCNGNGVPDEIDVLRTLDFSPRHFGVAASPFGYDAGLAHLDMENDGHLDLVLVNMFEQRELDFATNQGDGSFQDPTQDVLGLSNVKGNAVAAGEFYTDSRDELVVALNPERTGEVPELKIYRYSPSDYRNPPWSDSPRNVVLDDPVEQVAGADLDGDGIIELIVTPERGSGSIEIIRNDAGEAVRAATIPVRQVGIEPPTSVAVADINGSGGPELIFSVLAAGEVSLCENTGGLNFPSCTPYRAGVAPRMVKAADVDGDGRVDLIVANDYTNTISVLLNTSGRPDVPAGRLLASPRAVNLGPYANIYPKGLVVSDLDNDGDADVATANWLSNNVSVLPNEGTGAFSHVFSIPAGFRPEAIDLADVDGDGRDDLVVGNGNETFTVLYNRSRAPVSRDDDGDGRPDECN